MENRSNRLHLVCLFLLPLVILSFAHQADAEENIEMLLVLFGNRNENEEPAINLVYAENTDSLITLGVRFPEDVMRFIECCNQDTILYQPVQSYLQRTSQMSREEIKEEEEEAKKIISTLQVRKKKLFEKWSKSNGLYAVKANVELCDCIVDDPQVGIDKLHLLKSMK